MTLKGRQDESIWQGLVDRFDTYCGLKRDCSSVVEQRAVNSKVEGSNPSSPAIKCSYRCWGRSKFIKWVNDGKELLPDILDKAR